METVEVVIKIPKGYKELVVDFFGNNGLLPTVVNQELLGAISLGAVLPKGHGRLIDADDRRTEIDEADRWVVDLASTIIEADKEK